MLKDFRIFPLHIFKNDLIMFAGKQESLKLLVSLMEYSVINRYVPAPGNNIGIHSLMGLTVYNSAKRVYL